MFNLVLMIAFIVIFVGIFGYSTYKTIQLVKHPQPKVIDYPKEIKVLCYLLIGTGLASLLMFLFMSLYNSFPYKAGEWVELILGSLFFGVALPSGVLSFILHYYAKEMPEKLKKGLFYSVLVSALLLIIGLWLLTNSFADYLTYPLVNGLSFQKGFVTPASDTSPNLAFYAICILSGAIIVYFVCDHRYYKEYGEHGILESLLFVAFPAGVIGARIGYVIGEWNHGANSFAYRVSHGEWWAPFAIWEGGLTVISGALIGIIVGIGWFLWRNKKYSIWLAVDVIVPAILIAQACGRWGNFFNAEVHGLQSEASNWWFLPKIVLNNARYSSTNGWADPGKIFVPLFYIESISNLVGYFTIRFLIGKGLRKYIELGDLALLYIAWYGLTRVIMEPLRDSAYNMGNDGYWSWIWSFVFVFGSVLLIVINHIVRFIIRSKKGTEVILKNSLRNGLVTFSSILAGGIIFLVFAIILMVRGTPSETIQFNDFNNGLILLVIGLSLVMLSITALPYIIDGIKTKKMKEDVDEAI